MHDHDHWNHHLTTGLGLGFLIFPTFDALTKLVGLLACLVGIYCSISRERRDRRRDGDPFAGTERRAK